MRILVSSSWKSRKGVREHNDHMPGGFQDSLNSWNFRDITMGMPRIKQIPKN
jgi:hypothetical protein